MAKKPLEDPKTGMHRAHLWEIGFYALNNTSTNLYMLMMASISYYLAGIVGVSTVIAGSIVTIMRIWDGVTDPFVGMLVDNTNTKFGKNRPFIVIGQVILFSMSFLLFRIEPTLSTGARFPVYIIIMLVYYLGYTFQCVVTKSAQSCLTNDPEQRPVFSMFDACYNILAMSLWYPVYLSGTLMPNYTLSMDVPEQAEKIADIIAKNPGCAAALEQSGGTTLTGFYNPEMWQHFQLVIGGIAAVFACLAIIGLWRKDNIKYFGLGTAERIHFKDYADVLAHNRGIQMLVVAAASDKLATQAKSYSCIAACLFGVIFGNYALSGSSSAITSIPVVLLTLLLMNKVACKMGQKTAVIVGTYGSLAASVGLAIIIIVGANKGTFLLPTFSLTTLSTWGNLFKGSSWSLLGVLWVIVLIVQLTFSNVSGNIVIPMTADCADYEVYRTGRYVPGLMGTLFSFVDKLISSLGTTISSLIFAAIGFKEVLPDQNTPFSDKILIATLICYLGVPVIGWLCNLVAMKFYPLSKEKMAEISDEVARIKREAETKAKA